MQYHLVLTERCNLCCSYCGGTRHIEGLPLEPMYSIEDLRSFLEQDPEPVLGFYGGEPLLNIDYLHRVMDTVPAKAFTLQTNATHLAEVEDEYLQRIQSILVSIDGGREVTDGSRGAGVYDTVLKNLLDVERRGFTGDIIARMAFSKHGDIYRDVTHLLELENPRFDHVHWQLDVFWSELDSWSDLDGWLRRYDQGITRLIGYFREHLEDGVVPGIVPFIPVLKTLVTGEPTRIRCGAGVDSFAVMTNGEVHVCPIAPELPYSRVGDIYNSTPEDLRNSLPVGPPCSECPELWVCGGRCLFSNQTMFWGRDWFDRVCESTKHMIAGLESVVPEFKRLMDAGLIDQSILDYPVLNNGCEVIP